MTTNEKLPLWLLIIAAIGIWAGCSAAMLATGEKGVNVSAIQPGQTRDLAAMLLGATKREWVSATGIRYRTYEYDTGRPRDIIMAFPVAMFSFVTMGIAEFFLIPAIEKERTSARVVLSYDDREVILGIFDEFDDLPPDGKSGPRQWK